jgi:PAS domain S-box-containing protein
MFSNLKQFIIIILLIWLTAGVFSIVWNLYDDRREYELLALKAARTFLVQIKYMRSWNAGHHGVYVPVSKDTWPNPWLIDPKRDVHTVDGLKLTKINPAYMLRQLSELTSKNNTATFHITSLKPVRAENKPYPWEKPWLEQFRNGQLTEASGFFQEKNGTSFRYMAPMVMEQECLQCHEKQGYALGNIRGGISITLPMPMPAINWFMVMSHLLAMAAGSALILFFGRRMAVQRSQLLLLNNDLRNEIKERKEIQQQLQVARDSLEERVNERTRELSRANRELNRKIHERSKLEQVLTMIYDEFYQLFNSAPDGMLVIDDQFHILRVNRALCRLIRQDSNAVIGRKCYKILNCSTCRTGDCPLTRILEGEKRVELETVKQAAAGALPCIVTSTRFREPDGSLLGVIQVVKDISSRKKIEDALQESNRALEEFAHVISHDLQEPLMLIQAFSQRLQKKAAAVLPDGCDCYLDQINGSAERMQTLVRGLLQEASLNKTAAFTEVDLNEILTVVLDDLALRIEKTAAVVHVERLPMISADPLAMRQLFQNLLSNSIKYRQQEKRPDIHIRVQTLSGGGSGDSIQITVTDNGIGFANRDREKIFELFERQTASACTTRGTGIGLAICRKIVQQHHGSVTGKGEPGRGAVFTVILPVCQPAGNQG